MDGGDATSLYKSAEPYLATRDFVSLRRHVFASPHPSSLPATQLLTLSQILSQTRPDHYSLLFLPRFTQNPTRIRTQFKTLASLLNPNTNPISLSPEAYALLLEAHSVLSNPEKKMNYDNYLRVSEGSDSGSEKKPTFWTVCPYCYYVYEYDRVYLDCCLRCRNEGCRKGFTAVEIRVPPPEEVAGSGRYLCLGFDPIGFKGFSTWSPFSPDSEASDYSGGIGGVRNGVEKMGFKRRKSVGACSKKVMGKGVRVSKEEVDRILADI